MPPKNEAPKSEKLAHPNLGHSTKSTTWNIHPVANYNKNKSKMNTKMNIKYYTLLILLPIIWAATPHPIYVSNTEIDFKPETQKLEIAIKIYSDDLQKAISKEKKMDIEIGTDREHAQATDYIIEYLKKNFKMEINGKATPFEYVSRKLIEKDYFAMWILIQVSKVKKIKTFKLYNNILIDAQEQQQNFINFREDMNGSYKKFTTKKSSTSVELK